MVVFQTQLEFLNLDDVEANEADFIRNVLTATSPTVELPWSDAEEPPRVLEEWQQQPQQYGAYSIAKKWKLSLTNLVVRM